MKEEYDRVEKKKMTEKRKKMKKEEEKGMFHKDFTSTQCLCLDGRV